MKLKLHKHRNMESKLTNSQIQYQFHEDEDEMTYAFFMIKLGKLGSSIIDHRHIHELKTKIKQTSINCTCKYPHKKTEI